MNPNQHTRVLQDKTSRAIVTFEREFKKEILETVFDKTLNEENLIVEKGDQAELVPSFEGESISLEEFGGVNQGSEMFLKDDLTSIMHFTKKKR